MFPDSFLPAPLTHHELYILLALAQSDSHIYALKGKITQNSLGGVQCSVGSLYRLIGRMHDLGLIEISGTQPAGKSGKDRVHYSISEYGKIRLQEEYYRLSHALEIIRYAGLAEAKLPTDLQRLLLPRP